MPIRDSNINLNLTNDNDPAVQQQFGEEIEQKDADTAELPEYVTPPNPPGSCHRKISRRVSRSSDESLYAAD